MIDLAKRIAQIKALLGEDTSQSVTYAALEARLALEAICYDRLRERHDYISHADLAKWQPAHIIRLIMKEVDPYVTKTISLSIGRNPNLSPENDIYDEIGTEVGIDPNKIEKMWNALAKLALHISLPLRREDLIPFHGNKEKTRIKVEEVIIELELISEGNLTWAGIGEDVSFYCECGQKNKRRFEILYNGKIVYCLNPNCNFSYRVEMDASGDINFINDNVPIDCANCQSPVLAARKEVMNMRRDEKGLLKCENCDYSNIVSWRLCRANKES